MVSRGVSERRKQRRMVLKVRDDLGVPLDAEQEGTAGVLNCFDDAIWRPCGRHQAIAEAIDCLVMGSARFHHRVGDDAVQERAVLDRDCVTDVGRGVAVVQWGCSRQVVKVLYQRSTTGYVDNLVAQADSEDRKASFIGLCEDGKVVVGPPVTERDRLGMGWVSIATGRYVWAAGDEQGVDAIHLAWDE